VTIDDDLFEQPSPTKWWCGMYNLV